MKDFTVEAAPPLEFKIDADVFYATSNAPAGSITDLAAVVRAADDIEKLDAVMAFFDQVLMPESAQLFADRMRDPSRPIDFGQAVAVFEYLVEQYTDDIRPTTAASSSPSGSTAARKTSTRQPRSGASTRRVEVLPSV